MAHNDELIEALQAAQAGGVLLISMGDTPPPLLHLDPSAITHINANAATGGLKAGELAVSAARTLNNAAIIGAVVARPSNDRPRAAYFSLTVSVAGLSQRMRTVECEKSSDTDDLVAGIRQSITDAGPVIVACINDAQLERLALRLRDEFPDVDRTRVYLIGYDGTRRDDGELIAATTASGNVIGTVDIRPDLQGRIAAAELLRVASGLSPRGQVEVDPRTVKMSALSMNSATEHTTP